MSFSSPQETNTAAANSSVQRLSILKEYLEEMSATPGTTVCCTDNDNQNPTDRSVESMNSEIFGAPCNDLEVLAPNNELFRKSLLSSEGL